MTRGPRGKHDRENDAGDDAEATTPIASVHAHDHPDPSIIGGHPHWPLIAGCRLADAMEMNQTRYGARAGTSSSRWIPEFGLTRSTAFDNP